MNEVQIESAFIAQQAKKFVERQGSTFLKLLDQLICSKQLIAVCTVPPNHPFDLDMRVRKLTLCNNIHDIQKIRFAAEATYGTDYEYCFEFGGTFGDFSRVICQNTDELKNARWIRALWEGLACDPSSNDQSYCHDRCFEFSEVKARYNYDNDYDCSGPLEEFDIQVAALWLDKLGLHPRVRHRARRRQFNEIISLAAV